MKYLFLLFSYHLIVSSCTKEPVACFYTFPEQGDTIMLNEGYQYDAACSISATSWEWQFDNQIMVSKDFPYAYFKFTTPGLHSIHLTVTNKGRKARHASKNIFIKP